jgi:hypothetical protein
VWLLHLHSTLPSINVPQNMKSPALSPVVGSQANTVGVPPSTYSMGADIEDHLSSTEVGHFCKSSAWIWPVIACLHPGPVLPIFPFALVETTEIRSIMSTSKPNSK